MNSLEDIYKKFADELKYIGNFASVTMFSYDISELQFYKNFSIYQDYIKPPTDIIQDLNVDEFNDDFAKQCKWITIDDYAEKEETTIDELKEQIKLGNIRHVTLVEPLYLIYPPECQNLPLDRLPDISDQIFSIQSDALDEEIKKYYESDEDKKDLENYVKFPQEENLNPFEGHEHFILSQFQRLGNFTNVFEESQYKLFSSCFILIWIAFEEFLNAIILELFKTHPKLVICKDKNGRQGISFLDIFTHSNHFQDINSLAEHILAILLSKEEQSHEGIHSRIVFLKKNFANNVNIYEAPIYIDGKLETTNYNDVNEFREIRNFIIHNNSFAPPTFFSNHPKVPYEDNRIRITKRYLDVYYEKIRAISFYIFDSLKHILEN